MEAYPVIFIGFFIITSIVIIGLISTTSSNKRCTTQVTAEVVGYVIDSDLESEFIYAKCTYTYAGYTYTGRTEIYFSPEKLKARYPVGSKTTLYIDPDNPGNSIPRPADIENQTANGWLGFMIAVVIIGILLMLDQV